MLWSLEEDFLLVMGCLAEHISIALSLLPKRAVTFRSQGSQIRQAKTQLGVRIYSWREPVFEFFQTLRKEDRSWR
jgi:hypothetical protein